MKKSTTKPSHAEIGKGLGVSRSYASRLIRQGMPDDSITAAKEWIEQRAAESGATTAAATLADQRKEKLRLECALLALRLQRESDNVEFLPVDQVTGGIRNFLRFAILAMKFRADENAERLAATSTPQETIKILRPLLLESWATGVVAMLGQSELDARLVTAVRRLVEAEFCGITEDQIDRWMLAVNGKAAA
jgi:hypothetical protein